MTPTRLDLQLGTRYNMPVMTSHQRSQLERHRDRLLAALRELPNLMRGTVYTRQRKCGSPSCACAQGGPRHAGLQLTATVGGRTVTRFVRQAELVEVQAMVAAHQRLRSLVNELTEVNLELLRGEQVGGRKRRSR